MELITSIIGPLFGAICLITVIYYSNSKLRNNHKDDLRIVWYFFSLTLVISHIIGLWAISYGAIDTEGAFQGESGNFINQLIYASLDIKLSFTILGTITTIIILPQILSYVFSGIFGIAEKPLFLNESISFFIWGVIKTFIVISGVTSTIVILGYSLSLKPFSLQMSTSWALIALGFNSFAFFTLAIYRDSETIWADISQRCPNRVLNVCAYINTKLTRHIPPE